MHNDLPTRSIRSNRRAFRDERLSGWVTRNISTALEADRDRWILWLPVALSAGIALYFALPVEPPLWVALFPVAALIGLAFLVRGRCAELLILGLVFCCGFVVAQFRTVSVDAPQLARRLGPVSVTGRVGLVEPRRHGVRLTLTNLSIERLPRSETPNRIRLRVHKGLEVLSPGRLVSLRAVLMPLRPPVTPGAYDFQRHAYFLKIGATGFAISTPEPVRDLTITPGFWDWLEALRRSITDHIMTSIGGNKGAVAAALLTGMRGNIDGKVMDRIRASGLAHLLAISGLHVGMVAAIVFFFIRFLLVCLPGAALRLPVKKIAALASLAAAFFYLLLTGATVPTQRAFFMIAIVILGLLLDRVAISMRLVALAAGLLLLIAPESLLTPSFQMSFAAVIALVAVYESWFRRKPGLSPSPWTGSKRILRVPFGVALTSLIAGTATAPFAAYHFQRLAAYGLAANLVAVPIMTFWIMPIGLMALIAMPVGLDGPFLWLMGQGVGVVLAIATEVSSWRGATTLWPQFPAWGLVIVALGLVWLCLWKAHWRYWSIPIILAGLGAGFLMPKSDILLSHDGRLAAVRGEEGYLYLSSKRRARFTSRIWLFRDGQRERLVWDKSGAAPVKCDAAGCIYRRNGFVIAFLNDPIAASGDCRRADIIITTMSVGTACRGVKLLIDAEYSAQFGAMSIRLTPKGIKMKSDRAYRGERPWVIRPNQRLNRVRIQNAVQN